MNYLSLPNTWNTTDKDLNLKFSSLFKKVNDTYSQETKVFPKQNEIFKALEFCDPAKIKVLILGQDPYPTEGHAHGLAFSVTTEVKPIPKSLQNIFKEIKNDFPDFEFKNGNLEHWAKQGVLLLNSVLTVEAGNAGSHATLGWQELTDALIDIINIQSQPIVCMLWGNFAISKKAKLNNINHLILETSHPSPLSAYRGFLGSGHFQKANDYLESKGVIGVSW